MSPSLLYRAVFPRFSPEARFRPTTTSAAGAALRIRWLGTAGYVLEAAGTTIAIDPFVTRPSLSHLLGPLHPDDVAIAWRLPARLDAVLCGHSHFDHLLDAPRIAARTGALLVGSRSTLAFGRAEGLPAARLVEVPPSGRTLRVGALEVRFVPSLHGRIIFGRVPFSGEVTRPPALPRAWHYRMGGAFGILVRAPGVCLYHNGSADLVDAELAGEHADVLLVGLAGRGSTRAYLARLQRALGPRVIVPTHHDAFFAPLEEGLRLLPGVDLPGFCAEARGLAPLATLVTPAYDEVLAVPADDARGAALLAHTLTTC